MPRNGILINVDSHAHMRALASAFLENAGGVDPRGTSDDGLIARLLCVKIITMTTYNRRGRDILCAEFDHRVELARQRAGMDSDPCLQSAPITMTGVISTLSVDGIDDSTEQYVQHRIQVARKYLHAWPFARQTHNVAKLADDVLVIVVAWFTFSEMFPEMFATEEPTPDYTGDFESDYDNITQRAIESELRRRACLRPARPVEREEFFAERVPSLDGFWTDQRVRSALSLGL
jgi:hypothetical protein